MSDIDIQKLINQNNPKQDIVNATKTIYDASAMEIFWKNFLAGFSRALGNIILYIVFLIVTTMIFIRYISPIITPMLGQLENVTKSLDTIKNLKPPSL
jgi:hypothetical protein